MYCVWGELLSICKMSLVVLLPMQNGTNSMNSFQIDINCVASVKPNVIPLQNGEGRKKGQFFASEIIIVSSKVLAAI